jgi:hypothetical protein
MNIIPLSLAAEHLCEHIEQSSAAAQRGATDLLTVWQLIRLMTACGLLVPQESAGTFEQHLLRAKPLTMLGKIQHKWMLTHGLTEQPLQTSRSASALFFKSLRALIFPDRSAPPAEELVFATLQIVAGIPEQQHFDVVELVRHAKRAAARKNLQPVGDIPQFVWTAPEDVAEFCLTSLSGADAKGLDRLMVVTLPPLLQTPMSWSLNHNQSTVGRSIYLGWPSGGTTALSEPEQYALIAHEVCHVRQMMSAGDENAAGQTSTHTLFERELQALTCEWQELNRRIKNETNADIKRLRQRWRNANYTSQLMLLGLDVENCERSLSDSQAEIKSTSNVSETVRLPFLSAVYALSAEEIWKS